MTVSLFERKKFDVVYHCDVISHFFDPISELKSTYEKIKDGGWLVFETGNLGEVDQKYFKYFKKFQYPDHLFFFSIDNLRDLLERTDFELIKICRYSILPQLIAIKVFNKAYEGIKGVALKGDDRDEHRSSRNNEGNRFEAISELHSDTKPYGQKLIRNGCRYVNYLLRYKIGFIMPKTHRPQTVMVIARKRNVE